MKYTCSCLPSFSLLVRAMRCRRTGVDLIAAGGLIIDQFILVISGFHFISGLSSTSYRKPCECILISACCNKFLQDDNRCTCNLFLYVNYDHFLLLSCPKRNPNNKRTLSSRGNTWSHYILYPGWSSKPQCDVPVFVTVVCWSFCFMLVVIAFS